MLCRMRRRRDGIIGSSEDRNNANRMSAEGTLRISTSKVLRIPNPGCDDVQTRLGATSPVSLASRSATL